MLKLFLMSVARKDSDSSLLKTRQKLKLPNRNSMDQLLKVRLMTPTRAQGTDFRDTCSWKEQLEKNEKLESFNLESLKLESFCLSWKEPSEVEKNRAKLERTQRSWKVSFEVGKFRCRWKVLAEVGKFE